MSTERWHAVGRWVVEDCAEQPEEPMPLFQCDLPANAVTVANIYNEVCTERDAALARIAAVEAARDTMAETLQDIAEHGLWADLTPAMLFASMEQLYAQFSEYLRKLDASVRERAAAALAASPTPTGPETETK